MSLYYLPSIQSDAAMRSGVYTSFASLMKFGGRTWSSDEPQTWNKKLGTLFQIVLTMKSKGLQYIYRRFKNIPGKAILRASFPLSVSNLLAECRHKIKQLSKWQTGLFCKSCINPVINNLNFRNRVRKRQSAPMGGAYRKDHMSSSIDYVNVNNSHKCMAKRGSSLLVHQSWG